MTARLSDFQDSTSLQQMAVRRARQAVEQAEGKLKAMKKWNRDLETRAAPLLKEVEQLLGYLTAEMPKAVAHLGQIVKALDAYADKTVPVTPVVADGRKS
jgi:phage-related minor tail protein